MLALSGVANCVCRCPSQHMSLGGVNRNIVCRRMGEVKDKCQAASLAGESPDSLCFRNRLAIISVNIESLLVPLRRHQLAKLAINPSVCWHCGPISTVSRDWVHSSPESECWQLVQHNPERPAACSPPIEAAPVNFTINKETTSSKQQDTFSQNCNDILVFPTLDGQNRQTQHLPSFPRIQALTDHSGQAGSSLPFIVDKILSIVSRYQLRKSMVRV